MRSDSLTRSSSAPRTVVRPRAQDAASATSGSSSTSEGTISGSISVATSSGVPHLEVGDRLAGGRDAPVDEPDARAHALQHGQQAAARRG